MKPAPEEKLLNGMLNGVDIPPCPAILLELDAELRKEEPDQREVARLISKDVALSGHVMLIANSPAFSSGNKLVSVMQAINVLGMQSVFSMIVGHLLRVALADGADVSMETFLGKFGPDGTRIGRAGQAATLCPSRCGIHLRPFSRLRHSAAGQALSAGKGSPGAGQCGR